MGKRGLFFSGLWGFFLGITKRLKIFICLFNKKVIGGAPWHFLLTKFFKKNLKFFFDSKGSPLWILKKSKKNFKFFVKNFVNKKCQGPQMMTFLLNKQIKIFSRLVMPGKKPQRPEKKSPLFQKTWPWMIFQCKFVGYN